MHLSLNPGEPLRFDAFMEWVLYGEPGGFYSSGRGAGRRTGDFLTSPEVGPLFGRLMARLADRCWEELGRPSDFTLVDVGAGRGTLARGVLAARPACAVAGALRYVLVERSGALRRAHDDLLDRTSLPEVRVASLSDLPEAPIRGLILANELLDNLPCRLLERTADGWAEVYVTAPPHGATAPPANRAGSAVSPPPTVAPPEALPCSPATDPEPPSGSDRPVVAVPLVEELLPLDAPTHAVAAALAPEAPVGGRVPLATAAVGWVGRALSLLRSGWLVILEYTDTTASLAARPHREWVRTYRAGVRGHEPLRDPGGADITVEVPLDQIIATHPGAKVCDQASFLRNLGIDDLAAEGRATWHERAAVGDLAALEARSAVHETEALCDPTGLGAFTVAAWHR